MLKSSKYNILWEKAGSDNASFFAFNFLSQGFAKLNQEDYEKAKAILADPALADANDPLTQDLIKGSFLLDERFDEKAYLRYRNNIGRYNDQMLLVSLVPTTACNFTCDYCYEKVSSAKTMSREVRDNFLNWIEAASNKYKTISVIWYGGEPLLCRDILFGISERLKEIGKENGCNIILSLVTNGYLLDSGTADKLAGLDFEKVQITVDGTRETHDVRRRLKDGTGTYDKIIENINQAATRLKNVTIRVNVDKSNYTEAEGVMDFFIRQNWGKRVKFYFARVSDYTEACADYAGKCLSIVNFSRETVELARLAMNKGLLLANAPSIKYNYCGGDHINGFVLGPEGEIYKCWESVGIKDQIVGQLTANGPQKYGSFYKWVTYDPMDAQCEDCEFLPSCMGGCPAAKLLNKGKDSCNPLKHSYRQMLEIYYDYKNKQQEAGSNA
jgi:uncharacterized protein